MIIIQINFLDDGFNDHSKRLAVESAMIQLKINKILKSSFIDEENFNNIWSLSFKGFHRFEKYPVNDR